MVSHTAELAQAVSRLGADVEVVGWRRMYPRFLYEGEIAGPDDEPDTPLPPRCRQELSWDDPVSWRRAGARLGRDGTDVLVLVMVVPFHVVALGALLRHFRAARRRAGRPPARVVLVAHNVLPHESHPGSARLVRWLLRRVDATVVHSPEQAGIARRLGGRCVLVRELPMHLPGGFPTEPVERRENGGPLRLLFFGLVRDYKGVDLLLRAMARVPDVRLTVAGQLWGDAGREVARLASSPPLADRVTMRPGYVPAAEVPGLMHGHDVMVLPYRHATASQNVELAHAYGMPVLASRVGTFPDKVRDGVDGLLVDAGSVDQLVTALERLATAPTALTMARAVRQPELASAWSSYADAVLGAGGGPDR